MTVLPLVATAALVLLAAASASARPNAENGRIAYTFSRNGINFVATVDPDGSDRHVLGRGAGPVWSPDGRQIAYANAGIWIMAADGSGAQRLTEGGSQPSWSPDGRRIVYSTAYSSDGGIFNSGDLYVVDVGSSSVTQITHGPGTDASPAWAPDGSVIAYTYDGDLRRDVWTLRPDGTGARRVVRDADEPAWRPDGALTFTDAADPRHIFVLPRDATERREIAQGFSPAWSPDGRKLLFAASLTPRLGGDIGLNGLCIGEGGGAGARVLVYGGFDAAWQPAPVEAPTGRLRYSCDRPVARLAVSVRANRQQVPVGGHATFTISLLNRGPDPGATYLMIRLPSTGTSLDPARGFPRCGRRPYYNCAVGGLLPGERFTFRTRVRADEPGRLRLQATASSGSGASTAVLVRGCTILGTAGRDTLLGTPGRDVICGDAGGDNIHGGGGDDVVYGADGADRIFGGEGADLLGAGFGNDYADGGPGDDHLFGGLGDDDLFGRSGDDELRPGQPDGVVRLEVTDAERDRMHGGPGRDLIDGGESNDRLFGDGGDDLLLSRDGYRDYLICGRGRDRSYIDTRDRVDRSCEFNQPRP